MGDAQPHRPAGTLASGHWAVALDPASAGWSWASLRVLRLAPGESADVATGPDEMLVLPLAGSCVVSCGGEETGLYGRASVFDGPSDFVYLPRNTNATVHSAGGGRFALPGARADRDLPFRCGPAADPVELRGAGSCSRQVNNFCTESASTPIGCWRARCTPRRGVSGRPSSRRRSAPDCGPERWWDRHVPRVTLNLGEIAALLAPQSLTGEASLPPIEREADRAPNLRFWASVLQAVAAAGRAHLDGAWYDSVEARLRA